MTHRGFVMPAKAYNDKLESNMTQTVASIDAARATPHQGKLSIASSLAENATHKKNNEG